eukprot:3992509-Alexandrium_andersonii.AAC.1
MSLGRSRSTPPGRDSMSPLCAQGLLLRAAAHHVRDHPQEGDPLRAAGRHPADREAHPSEGDR